MSGRRLNVLLVMPRLVQNIGDGYVFPLGMAYVSASLKHAGFSVFTLNLNHRPGEVADILREIIEAHQIDLVGTGGLSPQYHLIRNILKSVKGLNPAILTVVGGGIITSQPEVAMEALEYADFGVIGEGEITICALVRTLEEGGDLHTVEGMIFRNGDAFTRTAPRADIENLDTLPWADYEGFDIGQYLELPPPAFGGLGSKRMIPMLASRSCPYKCTFCFHSLGTKYRKRSLDHFFGELDHLLARYPIEYISMADELFFPKPADVVAFSERMRPYGLKWHADFSINNVRPDLLPVMKAGGLDVMFLGLESADNRILASMRKGITIEKIEKVLAMIQDHGIPLFGCFIFGDVEETAESAEKTLTWWRNHPEHLIHLTLVKPFPGSQIYDYACREGMITDKIRYLKDGCPQVNISKLSPAEFARLAREISDASQALKNLENVQLLHVDPRTGRTALSAPCPVCGSPNVWRDVMPFAIHYLTCEQCVQKFHIPLPDEMRAHLEDNTAALLARHGKVGVWGMTLSAMDLFKHPGVFKDTRVFPIDISESKRSMDLYGQCIHDPGVLDREGISAVIITVPSHIGQISSQIRENHPQVTEILDACQLLGPPSEAVVHPVPLREAVG